MSRNFQRLGKLWLKCNSSISYGINPVLLCHRMNSSITVRAVATEVHPVNLSPSYSRNYSKTSEVRSSSATGQASKDDDRIKLFIDPEVQTLLKQLTGRDLKRIFRKRKIGQKLKEPKYTFMTEAQLREAQEEAEKKADKLLEMPPVLRAREPIDKVLEFDPLIQGIERSTLIFTDISMNVSDRERIIVSRDPDGTLRQATWDEREKMNAIYFPSPGKEFITPKMFTDPEAFQSILDRASEQDNTYEFILDRACLQFEPDDPMYISTAEATYDAIDRKGHYDFLKSTRHFGPMVFYLVRVRKMDGILMHSINQRRVSTDANNLVTLFHIIFPESKSKLSGTPSDAIDKIKRYIQLDGIRKGELELSLNAYLEEEERKQELEERLKRQHGIQSS